MPGLLALHLRPDSPGFLDLPWDLPLAGWRAACPRIVDVQRGLSRHEVQFVSDGPAVYAFKELPLRLAEREHDMLEKFEQRDLPAVKPVGWARVLGDDEEQGVLITRFLDASLPYRILFHSPGLERYRGRLIDALAGLLVRLHLAGAYWGDCSLSNVLFRRDAGELSAYLVDAETSELHDALSEGMRRQDLDIMEENVEGDLLDLHAQGVAPAPGVDEHAGEQVRQRYEALWREINREEVLSTDDLWRIHERVRALNALGFSVGSIDLVPDGTARRVKLRTVVTDRDHHRHQFHDLTGLVAEERQAEQLLNDLREFKLALSERMGRSVPMSVSAFHWRSERWEPAIARFGPLVTADADAAERFCQVLEHKWFMSERARRDVGLDAALDDYLRRFAADAAAATPVTPAPAAGAPPAR